MRAIITGVNGQDGAYLSKFLVGKGYKVLGLVRSLKDSQDYRLQYLGIRDLIEVRECDLMNFREVQRIIKKFKPTEIYNLSAQSSVGLSFSEPFETVLYNSQSVLTILESIRSSDKNIRFYQASSSEIFGKNNNLPITENSTMHPVSPYAISKATAYWSTILYRESYGIFSCNGILFNHESYLRGDSFFTKKLVKSAVRLKNNDLVSIELGNLDVSRDFGFAPEYVKAMYLMLQQDAPDDFIICSGSSISLREIVKYVFKKLDLSEDLIEVNNSLMRPNEIDNIYGDNEKAKKLLNWGYSMDFYQVLDILIDEEIENFKNSR